jgi:hypothetical protein
MLFLAGNNYYQKGREFNIWAPNGAVGGTLDLASRKKNLYQNLPVSRSLQKSKPSRSNLANAEK